MTNVHEEKTENVSSILIELSVARFAVHATRVRWSGYNNPEPSIDYTFDAHVDNLIFKGSNRLHA